jgi:predicted RNase H-like HicB family nuclease
MAKKGITIRTVRKTAGPFKIVVEKHADGFVAYPLEVQGVVVGQGDTYEGALADVESAIRFHIETFGRNVRQESLADR